MSRRKTLIDGGAVAAVSAAALLLTSGTAAAAGSRLPDDVTSFTLAGTNSDMQRIAAYWTPERLKEASTYVPATKPSPGTKASPSSVELVRGAASTPAKRAPGQPPMVGKVFFKLGDKEYWCSASVVH